MRMTIKSAFSARDAPMSLTWVHEILPRGIGIAKIPRKPQSQPQQGHHPVDVG
jgi:hypothetical protein